MGKLKYFNQARVCGLVSSFNTKELPSGSKLATIGVKDEKTTNLTYVSVFDRENLKYGKDGVTLQGLKKIFMTDEGKPRNVYAKFVGTARETTSVKDGTPKTYFNIGAHKIEPASVDSEHYSVVIINGIVDAIKIAEDKDENPYAKLKIGSLVINKDGDVIGVDYITSITRDEKLIEKLEDVERNYFVKLQCDVLNTLPETDRFGNIIASGKKEVSIVNIVGIVEEDDIDEDELDLYKKAKRLQKGEKITVTEKEQDELEDEDLDF